MKLNKLQQIVLQSLASSPLKDDFYWTGGTALTLLWLKHRNSQDLDFFSDKPIDYYKVVKLIKNIARQTQLKKIEEKKIFDRWEFLLTNKETLRVEFVHYDFPPLKNRKNWQGILVDSLQDMAANKTMAMIERHEPKDAFDIYCLIKVQKFTPEKLLKLAKKKFGLDISLSQFWSEALLGAKDLEKIKVLLPGSLQEQSHKIIMVAEYFQKSSAQYLRRQF